MAFSCSNSCSIEADKGFFLVAGCGYFDRDSETNDFILTQPLLDAMRRLALCESVGYTPDVEESTRPKYCADRQCRYILNGYEMNFTIELCDKDDTWFFDLAHPRDICEVEFLWGPCAINCLAPSVDDFMIGGTIVMPPTGWERTFGDANWDFPLTGQSCEKEPMIFNDPSSAGLAVPAPLQSGNKGNKNLVAGKEAIAA